MSTRAQPHIPIRRLTDPKRLTPNAQDAVSRFHWFGYYDKLQFDPSERYVLGMSVNFEGRAPQPSDELELAMIDLEDGDRWQPIGTSRAWGWQQGCMLQWRPGSSSEVIWNDRVGEPDQPSDGKTQALASAQRGEGGGGGAHFVSHLLNVHSGERRTLPEPVYCLSPDGRFGLGCDFARIDQMRPGYGYAGVTREDRDQLLPASSWIYRLDLETGERTDLFSLRDVASIANRRVDFSQRAHWVNHLLINPDASRFVFLHRWADFGSKKYGTRMITADPFTAGGTESLHVLEPLDKVSHFIWRDPRTLLVWARHEDRPEAGAEFYLVDDPGDHYEPTGTGVIPGNGHCTFLPGGDWLLSDAIAKRPSAAGDVSGGANASAIVGGFRDLFVYHLPTQTKRLIGSFFTHDPYDGQFRCDVHPRQSPSGRRVTVDSVHEGLGRQIYLLDIDGAWDGP